MVSCFIQSEAKLRAQPTMFSFIEQECPLGQKQYSEVKLLAPWSNYA